jgi:threonine aldolase
MNRRVFFQKGSGVASLLAFYKPGQHSTFESAAADEKPVNFWNDAPSIDPQDYARQLYELTSKSKLVADAYGTGKIMEELEALFVAETGKESCVFLPTGTLANQLALRVLSGIKNKVIVPETSHIYRDEADAAQVIHGKRLVPLAPGKAVFTADELEKGITMLKQQEVFPGSIGALSIENTNRRCYEEVVELAEMKKIFQFARNNNIQVHLDGARLYIASAYSGISVKEYAAQADTVYISLYKYFGAGTGAVLCGDKETIASVRTLAKPMGASTYQNWMHASMAMEYHKQFLLQYPAVVKCGQSFASRINSFSKFFRVEAFTNGSNMVKLVPTASFKKTEFITHLRNNENIRLQPFNQELGFFPLKINATLLNRSIDDMVESFEAAARNAQ